MPASGSSPSAGSAKAMQPRLEEHWHAARVATAALDTETGGVLVEVINRANAALARAPVRRTARAPPPLPRERAIESLLPNCWAFARP